MFIGWSYTEFRAVIVQGAEFNRTSRRNRMSNSTIFEWNVIKIIVFLYSNFFVIYYCF